MSNPNYVAGRAFEYVVMGLWKDLNKYDCIRASGSHGKFDVVAFRVDRLPEFIQCKRAATEVAGKLLIKKFKESNTSSQFYHQSMYVKIKGSKRKDMLWATI